MARRAHAQSLFNPRIDIADRQRRHRGHVVWYADIVRNDSVECKSTKLPLNWGAGAVPKKGRENSVS
jgi:hypothetical protein